MGKYIAINTMYKKRGLNLCVPLLCCFPHLQSALAQRAIPKIVLTTMQK